MRYLSASEKGGQDFEKASQQLTGLWVTPEKRRVSGKQNAACLLSVCKATSELLGLTYLLCVHNFFSRQKL